jgi:hypothetical protein
MQTRRTTLGRWPRRQQLATTSDGLMVRSFHCYSGTIQIVLSSDCLCSAPEYIPHNSPVHSFQLRTYEQGTRAKLNQADDDLCALRRERDDPLRDLNASKGQTRVWVAEVDMWKSEARPLSCITLRSVLTLAPTAGG